MTNTIGGDSTASGSSSKIQYNLESEHDAFNYDKHTLYYLNSDGKFVWRFNTYLHWLTSQHCICYGVNSGGTNGLACSGNSGFFPAPYLNSEDGTFVWRFNSFELYPYECILKPEALSEPGVTNPSDLFDSQNTIFKSSSEVQTDTSDSLTNYRAARFETALNFYYDFKYFAEANSNIKLCMVGGYYDTSGTDEQSRWKRGDCPWFDAEIVLVLDRYRESDGFDTVCGNILATEKVTLNS